MRRNVYIVPQCPLSLNPWSHRLLGTSSRSDFPHLWCRFKSFSFTMFVIVFWKYFVHPRLLKYCAYFLDPDFSFFFFSFFRIFKIIRRLFFFSIYFYSLEANYFKIL